MQVGTPKTEAAKFTITAMDIGTQAVRPGHMAELEEERLALLLACKATLTRIRSGVGISAMHEFMLEAAVKVAETP